MGNTGDAGAALPGPHPYPLVEGVQALPLGALAEAWGLVGPVGASLE